jgi:pilus assembly protein CpaB
MGRRTLLLIASILVAALGTALIWLYVQGADTRAEASTTSVQIPVAASTYEPGTQAKSIKTVLKAYPQALVDSFGQELIRSPNTVNGYAQTKIVAGLPLLQNQFGKQAAAPAPAVDGLGSDEIAMMVTLPDPQRLAGLLQPGTQIRVFASVENENGKKKGVLTLFNRVRVLSPATSIEAAPGAKGADAVPQASVLLALNPKQAKMLALSQFQAGGNSLWFGLLGQKVGNDDASTINSIVGD